MKRILNNSYKLLLLVLLVPFLGFAQSKRESIESFDVDKNPEIKLDLSHAQIIVSTWNKNKVEVKTTLTSENLNQEEVDEIFDANAVKVLGNSRRVEISSNQESTLNESRVMVKRIPLPPSPPNPPRVKGAPTPLKGKVSTNSQGVPPPPPPSPPQAPLEFNFDYKAFKEDGKAYLEKFKEQMETSNFKEEMEEFKEAMLEWSNELASNKLNLIDYTIDTLNAIQKIYTFRMDSVFPNIKGSVTKRTNQIQKVIEIKVPKSATFEVDLRHSKLNADVMKNLSAKLRYSDFQLKDLLGENSEVQMNYSTLLIGSANKLKLNLLYSKKVELVQVNEVNVKSKMSNFKINHLKSQALIDGSYGELVINEIDTDFSLVDIQLEKSRATLILPKTLSYKFYAKSSNSKFNMNSDLDFKMSKSFDDVIYTNSAKTDNSKTLSLSANYSTVDLN